VAKPLRCSQWRRRFKFMLDVIYVALVIFIFAALALYARGCGKL
jgi:hypothetical protein